jgi:hypothetical protein
MNDKELKVIYEYMKEVKNWGLRSDPSRLDGYYYNKLDSNSAWEVVQEMEIRDEFIKFYLYIEDFYFKQSPFGFNSVEEAHAAFFIWLYNPTNFFNCFAKWLLSKEEV